MGDMRYVNCALAVTVCLLVTHRASVAVQMSTADLLSLCESPGRHTCELYIRGVIEGSDLAAKIAGDHMHFCIPKDLTAPSLARLVETVMAKAVAMEPEDRQAPAAPMIGQILLLLYPCARSP
jgi:hypothetical protein